MAEDSIELDVEYKDFHAYRDHMSHTLRVTGTCVVRGGGVAVGLQPYDGNPGTFPSDRLVLTLQFTVTAEDPSEQPVEWKRGWDDERYKRVAFAVKGPKVNPSPPQLEVEDVH